MVFAVKANKCSMLLGTEHFKLWKTGYNNADKRFYLHFEFIKQTQHTFRRQHNK